MAQGNDGKPVRNPDPMDKFGHMIHEILRGHTVSVSDLRTDISGLLEDILKANEKGRPEETAKLRDDLWTCIKILRGCP